MPTLSPTSITSATEAAWPRGVEDIARCREASDASGYGFENALCMIESQSPWLRPPADDAALVDIADPVARNARALALRVALLDKLLGCADIGVAQRRALRTTSLLVLDELIATLGPDAHRRANDPAIDAAQRRAARDSLAAAHRLAEQLRAAPKPFGAGIIWC